MEARHYAKVQRFRAHSVQNEREGESGNQAGDKGACIGGAGALAHFVHFRLVVEIVAHFAGPGFGKEQGRIPEEAENHGDNCRHQNREPIQAMHVHARISLFVLVEESWAVW